MLKEQQPFDLAKVQETLKIYQEQVTKLKELWPETSKAEDSASLPSVWNKRTEFLGRFDAFLASTSCGRRHQG
jgi:cytochrome c556